MLTLDASTDDPRQLADGLLALVGDDMHAHRCSLMLRTPDGGSLYIAAARGVAPGIAEGTRVAIGQGVAGRVGGDAASRCSCATCPRRSRIRCCATSISRRARSSAFRSSTTTSWSGVVNLANRAMQGVFVEEDVDRVRLLGLVIALVASHARLPERLVEALSVR